MPLSLISNFLKNIFSKNLKFQNQAQANLTPTATPFFDTRDVGQLRMVANIILYPYEYCLRPGNRARVLEIAPGNTALVRLIQILELAQLQLSAAEKLTNSSLIWSDRERHSRLLSVQTSVDISHPETEIFTDKSNVLLNTRLLEGVVERTPFSDEMAPDDEAIRKASECIWLSDHLALFVLGVASLKIDERGALCITPASENAKKHLRRVWFGNAFEEMSLRAASATLETFSYEMTKKQPNKAVLEDLHIRALCVFPQHWRLPVEDGPVSKLIWDYLDPLLRILTNVLIENNRSSKPRPLRLKDAKSLNAVLVFEIVYDMQRQLPIVDRLFDVVDDGLILGTRTLAAGAIAIAEHIAATVLGKEWHSDVSETQKAYVVERLSTSPNVEILEEELLQHDSECEIPLDVDFFVKDKAHGKIYAIQLKHFEQSDRGGLLAWVARLRERDTSLGKAVKQLENLQELVTKDKKIQMKLNSIGISTSEFSCIIPVVLHTVGTIDFWELQSGVLLHDIGTFCNVINGFSSTSIGISNDQFISKNDIGSSLVPSLHQTDSVIDAYSRDPRFKRDLQHFDLAKKITRSLYLNNQRIEATGLGV